MAKTIEQVAAEKEYLKEAEAYAKSQKWEAYFDFSTMGELQDYFDKKETAEDAIDDLMNDIDFDTEDED